MCNTAAVDKSTLCGPNNTARTLATQVPKVTSPFLQGVPTGFYETTRYRLKHSVKVTWLPKSVQVVGVEDTPAKSRYRGMHDPWESILAQIPRSVTVQDDLGRQEIRILWESMTAADGEVQCCASATILEHVLRVPRHQQNTAHGKRMAIAMRKCGWQRHKNGLVRVNGENVRGYYRAVPEGLAPLGGTKTKAEKPGPRGLGATDADTRAALPF